MTAVLISIKPKWCELIANGQKTVEVRKSRPKFETPFKCYICCTSVKNMPLLEYVKIHWRTGGKIDDWHGKVIGEFICDKIYQYSTGNVEGIDISDEDMIRFSCLSKEELCDYEMSAEPKENCVYRVGLYGWHISDLKIYDEPKVLYRFFKPCGIITRPPQSWCYVEEVWE